MNNGIFIQNLLDKQNSDIGLPRSSLVNSDITPMPYSYGGDEYWRSSPNQLVLVYDTRYGSNRTITLPLSNGNAYNILVDWGDGIVSRHSTTGQNVSYTYKRHGVYTVQISGSLIGFGSNFTNANANKLIKCISFGIFASMGALYYFLNGCVNALEVPNAIPSGVNQLQFFFSGASSFNNNISSWNTSNITNMTGLFNGASRFNQPLDSWNISSVTNTSSMFQNTSYNQSLNNWNTANITNMSSMFQNATSFNQPLSNWNVRKVTTFANMFNGATAFNRSLDGWALGADTGGTSCLSMFQRATAFNQTLDTWNTSKITNMGNMFSDMLYAFNQNLGSWNTSSVSNMALMFYSTGGFNNGGSSTISNWDTSNVLDMSLMFYAAFAFNQPIGTWTVSKVRNMSQMFNSAYAFNQDISNWNLAGLNANTSLDNFMLNKTGTNALSTANYDALLIGWNNKKLIGANGVANWRTDLRPHFGGAKYTSGGAAAAARAALVSYGWTITDGGIA